MLDEPARYIAYAALDLVLAVAFFNMSRERWFPLPLFYLHGGLIGVHLITIHSQTELYWAQMALNRAFDVELAYIIGCACFRLVALKRAGRFI